MIERLLPPADDATIRGLALLLIDAVDSGAAVTFLAPLALDRAVEWWRKTVNESREGAIFLIARDEAGITGTVQVQPVWAVNQMHRAEIAKLLVHRRARGAGLGRRLMEAAEDAARRAGFTLLTLDTKRGDAADNLYRSMGWTCLGAIPGYAFDPDGRTLHDAAIFYKHLAATNL
ncbi:MAG TPA: GNAT family N-acetyltransferase [Phycisphaerales bacterium]|nr:GNAT family N-acetyltransferase [Phycisphaerales bacterium]HRQ76496.1 GNAT family N-acetyltransferase [Phycisphaerales bacterium]